MVHCKVAKLCNFFKSHSQQVANLCNFLQKSKMCIFLHFVAVKQHLRPLNLHLTPYKQQFFLTSVVLTRLHFLAPICYTCHKSRRRNQNTQLQPREENVHASKHQTENHLSGGREQNQQQDLEQHESRSHQRQLADHRRKTEQPAKQDRQIR